MPLMRVFGRHKVEREIVSDESERMPEIIFICASNARFVHIIASFMEKQENISQNSIYVIISWRRLLIRP